MGYNEYYHGQRVNGHRYLPGDGVRIQDGRISARLSEAGDNAAEIREHEIYVPAVPLNQKGAADGVAELGADRLVPITRLPNCLYRVAAKVVANVNSVATLEYTITPTDFIDNWGIGTYLVIGASFSTSPKQKAWLVTYSGWSPSYTKVDVLLDGGYSAATCIAENGKITVTANKICIYAFRR